ncbi:hypothetical protein [Flavobacterium aestivum]|uniref:hypothetical protein n=1 Tax=Flavobacterium aestivum TaxID=3003257 RepID=UPI0024821656|nr:hypothetical protein [Flavobacterium aestivum]
MTKMKTALLKSFLYETRTKLNAAKEEIKPNLIEGSIEKKKGIISKWEEWEEVECFSNLEAAIEGIDKLIEEL